MNWEEAMAFFDLKKRHYQLVFNKTQPSDMIVLSDIAKFCRAAESTFHNDPQTQAYLNGRRDVWLHISKYLNLSVEQIVQLQAGGVPQILEQTRSDLK